MIFTLIILIERKTLCVPESFQENYPFGSRFLPNRNRKYVGKSS